jgi:IS30 family transposase
MLIITTTFRRNFEMCPNENNNIEIEKRKGRHLSEQERYKIEGYKEIGMSNRKIAEALGKAHSGINKEIKRGEVLQRKSDLSESKIYKADYAQRKADEAGKNKGTGLKIGNDHKLVEFLEIKIRDEKYSPDAALAAARKQGGFKTMICTRTLYSYIEDNLFLRISNDDLLVKKKGVKRRYNRVHKVALNNKNGKSITERSESVNAREEKGHWEIDLVVGKQGTKPVVLTLVERVSRKSIYVLLKNKTQEEVLAALRRIAKKAGGDFSEVFKTITADNGSEFLDSSGIKEAVKCEEVYYAHPYSSWERGSNENGNRMLRRFIPKGTDLSDLTEERLQVYEDWVNNYPRRILKYMTANEMYAAV